MADPTPTSDRAIEMGADDILVSSTDLHGKIVFANEAFVKSCLKIWRRGGYEINPH